VKWKEVGTGGSADQNRAYTGDKKVIRKAKKEAYAKTLKEETQILKPTVRARMKEP